MGAKVKLVLLQQSCHACVRPAGTLSYPAEFRNFTIDAAQLAGLIVHLTDE